MKNVKLIIIILFLSLIYSNVFAQEICSKNGYTILTMNGIFTDDSGALLNKTKLQIKLPTTYNNQPITVDYLYNETHLGGAGDLLDSVRQGLFDPKSDYDLVEMLDDASSKVKTQKVLLVGHSQGNFYANNFYNKVVNKDGGIPSASIGVYSVASPDYYVSGNGKYLTSDTDLVIAAVVGRLKSILPPNNHIELQKGDDNLGHNFSTVYLKYRSAEIVADIKASLDKLQSNTTQEVDSICINPPKITALHKVTGGALAVGDFLVNGTKKVVTLAYNGVISTTRTIASGISSLARNSLALVGLASNDTFDTAPTITQIESNPEANTVLTTEQSSEENIPTDNIEIDSQVKTEEIPTIPDIPNADGKDNIDNTNNTDNAEVKDEIIVEDETKKDETPIIQNGSSGGGGGGGTPAEEIKEVTKVEEEIKVVEEPVVEPVVEEVIKEEVDGTIYTVSDLNMNSIDDSMETEVIVSVSTSLSAGNYKFKSLEIPTGVTLTLKSDPESLNIYKGVKIKADNIKVNQGGFIKSDSEGYAPFKGPGVSLLIDVGSSYGGKSIRGLDESIYGSATLPLDLGSGANGKGGGAIYLEVKDNFINNGAISSNGGAAASGGSIYLKTKNLSGSGAFSANGGGLYGSGYFKSPGGGGRVALYYEDSSFTGISEAAPGSGSYDGWSRSSASPGTVGLFDIKNNNLKVTSSWKFEEKDSPFNYNQIIFTNKSIVETGKNVNIKASSLLVEDGSNFTLSSAIQTIDIPSITIDKASTFTLTKFATLILGDVYIKNGSTMTTKVGEELTISLNNLNIDTTSKVNANEKGMGIYTGSPNVSLSIAGASYGGYGYGDQGSSIIYGDENEPIDMGSAGYGNNSRGGGAIKITVANNFVNDGYVSANGSNTASGGSIYVITDKMNGVGFFTANGGTSYCPNICFGPGGGGRVAIHYNTSTFVKTNATSLGWSGYGGASMNGTVKWIDRNVVVPVLSSAKELLSFNFELLSPLVIGTVSESDHTVNLMVPFATDIKALIPTIEISEKSVMAPLNQVAQDFTNPVVYTLKAEDNSTLSYIISVTVEPDPNPVPPVEEEVKDPIVEEDTGDPIIKSYTLNGGTGSITINPLVNNLSIILNSNKNVDWVSVKIENQSNNRFYKIFYSGNSCVDGSKTCTKVWNGLLSGGGLLQNGNYKIKVRIKDTDNREYNAYLPALIIVNL